MEAGLKIQNVFSESETEALQADMNRIRAREQSMTLKNEGDKWFEEGIYPAALSKYEDALKVD